MRRRKLIHPVLLAELNTLTEQGVPLMLAMRKHNVDMSRPTVKNLLNYYKIDDKVVKASLFPKWIFELPKHRAVGSQPDNYYYEGDFPLGVWCCKT